MHIVEIFLTFLLNLWNSTEFLLVLTKLFIPWDDL